MNQFEKFKDGHFMIHQRPGFTTHSTEAPYGYWLFTFVMPSKENERKTAERLISNTCKQLIEHESVLQTQYVKANIAHTENKNQQVIQFITPDDTQDGMAQFITAFLNSPLAQSIYKTDPTILKNVYHLEPSFDSKGMRMDMIPLLDVIDFDN